MHFRYLASAGLLACGLIGCSSGSDTQTAESPGGTVTVNNTGGSGGGGASGGGGTGSGGPGTTGAITSIGQLPGMVFATRYYLQDSDPNGQRVLRGTGEVRVISASEIQVTVDGRSFTMYATAEPGRFERPGSNGEYAYFIYPGVMFSGINVAPYQRAYSVFGLETNPSNLSGTVQYSGRGLLIGTGPVAIDSRIGSMALTADFNQGSVSGTVFQDADITLTIRNGQVAGSGFTGTLDGPAPIASGLVEGSFYNDAGTGTGGSFEGTFTAPVMGITQFTGVFHSQ